MRKLHELLEFETVNGDLQARTARAMSWIESARKQAFFAFEKMGKPGSTPDQAKFDVSSIGDETKVKILRLNAAFIEAAVQSIQGQMTLETLTDAIYSVTKTLREEAEEIEARLKKGLEGPPEA